MVQRFKIIIIGSGPAGLAFANEFGEGCLVLEKSYKINGRKICGESVSKQVFDLLGFETQEILPFIKATVAKIRLISGEIFSETNYSLNGNFERYIIDRQGLMMRLASLAAGKGAQIRIGIAVEKIFPYKNHVKVVTNANQEFSCDCLVFADGALSLGRQFGITATTSRKQLAKCCQYEMANLNYDDKHRLDIYLSKEIAPGGYAYIFPKGPDIYNVGIGVCGDSIVHTPKFYLDRFIAAKPEIFNKSSILFRGDGAVTGAGPTVCPAADRLICIGEAGGFVDPFTGGGIRTSVKSALLAAKHVRRALEDKDLSKQNLEAFYWEFLETEKEEMDKHLLYRKTYEQMDDEQIKLMIASSPAESLYA